MPEIGQTLAHYTIVEKPGEGGMGVIDRAEDTDLDAIVAIRVPPAGEATDPDWKHRHIQVARSAPVPIPAGIITAFAIASAGRVDSVALDYVRRQTPDSPVADGLPASETLKISTKLAGAPAGWHSAGVTHLETKRGIVMVCRQARAKVLELSPAEREEAHGPQRQKQPAPPHTTGASPGLSRPVLVHPPSGPGRVMWTSVGVAQKKPLVKRPGLLLN